MATIGIEVGSTLFSTNVEYVEPVFDNTVYQIFPAGMQLPEIDSLYENLGEELIPAVYDLADEPTYIRNQVIYKDSFIQKVTDLTDQMPEQPEDYSTGVEISFDQTTWTKRYMQVASAGFTGGYIGPNSQFTATTTSVKGVDFSPDGLTMYTVDSVTATAYCYTLLDPYAIETAVLLNSLVLAVNLDVYGDPYKYTSLTIGDNGTKMYLRDKASRPYHGVVEYNITSGTLAGASYNGRASLPNVSFYSSNLNLKFSPDGSTMFVVMNSGYYSDSEGWIWTFPLGTAWNALTYDYNNRVTFNPQPSYTEWESLEFSSDGGKAYILESSFFDDNGWKTYLMEYTLSSPYSFVGATETGREYTTSPYPSSMVEIQSGNFLVVCSGSTISKNQLDTVNDFYTRSTDAYYINLVDGKYNFTSVIEGVSLTYEDMTVYNTLVNDVYEPIAYTTSNTGFLARTLIINSSGWYIRTSVDAPIEYIILPTQQVTYAIITSVRDIPQFVRVSASNPYKPFDGTNITPAVSLSPMEYIIQGDAIFNSFTLAKVLASSLTYTFIKANGDALEPVTVDIDCKRDSDGLLSLYPTTVIFYAGEQLEVGSKVSIVLTHSDTIQLGDFTLNNSVAAGFTDMTFSHAIQDYNDYTPDAWGQIPEAVKAIVTKFDIATDIRLENYDHAVSFNESISGRFITIDGSDSNNQEADSITVFNSLVRRVLVKSITSRTIMKDNDLWVMANTKISVQEII